MTWNVKPSRFNIEIDDSIAERRRDIALHAFQGVVLKTPVDTGRARGSWQVTGGAPAFSQSGVLEPDRDAFPAQTLASGFSSIAGLMNQLQTTIFISSNLPYIRKLESGASDQARQGMVAVTLSEIRVRYAT